MPMTRRSYIAIFLLLLSSPLSTLANSPDSNVCDVALSPSEHEPMIKAIIRGVEAIPQSSAGSVLHNLPILLSNPDKITEIMTHEIRKRTAGTFAVEEFERLVRVANNKHAGDLVQSLSDRAKIINSDQVNLGENEFLFGNDLKQKIANLGVSRDFNNRMFWRFMEIYNFPVDSLPDVLEGVLRAHYPNEYVVATGNHDHRKKHHERKIGEIENVVGLLNQPEHEHIKASFVRLSEIVTSYINSPLFRKERRPYFQKTTLELARIRKESQYTSQVKEAEEERDAEIANLLVFDLYSLLREHYEPDQSLFLAFSLIGASIDRSAFIYRTTMFYRKKHEGLSDAYLQELLPYIKSNHKLNILGEKFFR